MGEASRSDVARVVRRLLEGAHQLEPGQVPTHVADEAARAGFRDVELFLVDNQQVHLTSLTDHEQQAVDGTLAGDAYRRGRSHVVEDGDAYRVYVPLLDGEDRLGVLTTVIDDASDDRIDDVHALATVTASLLVSKDAYTDEFEIVRRSTAMDLAAEFRWALLPPLTMTTPRVFVAGMVEPAYEIAGDAFDYAVNGDVLHFALFDAVGHGLRACQLANLAVATYRNTRRAALDLVHAAAAIDAALVDQFGESWFVTALFGELDLERGRFRWCSAGHPLPVLVRGGRVVLQLEAKPARPLGLGGLPPEIAETHLEPDDTIFCFSDGVTEARDDSGDFFGEERLSDYLARAAADEFGAAEMVRRLVLRLYEHRPAPLHDDATMLSITWSRR